MWPKQIFVYKDENFAMNLIRPKFLSLLLTDEICIGVDRKVYSQKVFVSSKLLHNIKLPDAYSEFTAHTQNQLSAGSFVDTKFDLSHDMPFFSYAHAPKWMGLRTPH